MPIAGEILISLLQSFSIGLQKSKPVMPNYFGTPLSK